MTDPFAGWADAQTYEFPTSRTDPGPPVVLSEGYSEPQWLRVNDPKSGLGVGWEPAPCLSCAHCGRETSRSVVSAVMVDSGRRPNRFGVERIAQCPSCGRARFGVARHGPVRQGMGMIPDAQQKPDPPAEAPEPTESVSSESAPVSARSSAA